jgi:CheY-specific phosphatase CheX
VNASQLPQFADSLRETFLNMLGVELNPGSTEEAEHPIKADLSACLSVEGTSRAILVLGFDSASAVDMASRFVQMPCNFEDPLVSDAARELLNILVGAAQKRIRETFSFSLPLSAQGLNHEISGFRGGRIVFTTLTWGDNFSLRLFLNLPG